MAKFHAFFKNCIFLRFAQTVFEQNKDVYPMSTRRNAWGARACGFSKEAAVYPSVYPIFHADS